MSPLTTNATENRVEDNIDKLRRAFLANPSLAEKVEGIFTLSFEEHFAYQTVQSHAFASGVLTLEEAHTVYTSMGEMHTETNDGWAEGTDLATKMVVTALIGALMKAGIR